MKHNSYITTAICMFGLLLIGFFYFEIGLSKEATLHKEKMIMVMHAAGFTLPNMSITESLWINKRYLFDCGLIDGGHGRFRYVGYFYELISAQLIFLNFTPRTLHDHATGVLVFLSATALFYAASIHTNSKLTGWLASTGFLLSTPALMVLAYHYRGPKIIACLMLAITLIFLAKLTKTVSANDKPSSWLIIAASSFIVLGVLSDPFFILIMLGLACGFEVCSWDKKIVSKTEIINQLQALKNRLSRPLELLRKNSATICLCSLGWLFSGPIFAIGGFIIGKIIDTRFGFFTSRCFPSKLIGVSVVCGVTIGLLLQLLGDNFFDTRCSILNGINNADQISDLDNLVSVFHFFNSIFNIFWKPFGSLFLFAFVMLTAVLLVKGQRPVFSLSFFISMVLMMQLWPSGPAENYGYPSYYGLIPQLFLCLSLVELLALSLKVNPARWAAGPLFAAVIFVIFNTWYSDTFTRTYGVWSNSHQKSPQQQLWKNSGRKLINQYAELNSIENMKPLIFEFSQSKPMPYSAIFGDPSREWHKSIPEHDFFIPFFFSEQIKKGEIVLLDKTFRELPIAIESGMSAFDKKTSKSEQHLDVKFDLVFINGAKNLPNGFSLSDVALGYKPETMGILHQVDHKGNKIPICRVVIPRFTEVERGAKKTYFCQTKKAVTGTFLFSRHNAVLAKRSEIELITANWLPN
ncbi:hypothetical protein N9I82_00680 [Alphaproteobacteria bacterium]|nr:hypothetical protein [Alphaproteobacteria bacterium]